MIKFARIYKFLKFIGRTGAIWSCASLLSGVLLAGTELALSITLILLLHSLKITDQNPQLPFGLGNLNVSTYSFLLLMISLGTLRGLLQFLVQQSAAFGSEIIGLRLRQMLIYQYFKINKTAGSLAEFNTLHNDIFLNSNWFCQSLVMLAPLIVQSIILCGILTHRNFILTFSGVMGVGIVGLFVHLISKRSSAITSLVPVHINSVHKRVIRSLRNWNLLRSLRMIDTEFQAVSSHQFTKTSITIRGFYFANLASAIPTTFGIFVVAGLIGLYLKNPMMSGMDFLAYLYLFLRFVQNLGGIATYFGNLSQSYPQFKRAVDFFFSFTPTQLSDGLAMINKMSSTGHNWSSIGKEIFNQDHTAKIPYPSIRKSPQLEVKNIDFYYSPNKKIISQLNLTIPARSSLAIIGESGSGKSTFLFLLLGILEPTQGTIRIEGLTPDQYFKSFPYSVGYVGADSYLMEGTVRENLLYGNPYQVSENDIFDALRSAQLLDWAKSNPQALDFHLTENGDGLSTGQKQRLSLARALLLKPALLVLDEISANLDIATENEIAETLKAIENEMTIIIVSHREGLVSHIANRMQLKII